MLIAVPTLYGWDTIAIAECGHGRAQFHPTAAFYFIRLVEDGRGTYCPECPADGRMRAWIDVLTRRCDARHIDIHPQLG